MDQAEMRALIAGGVPAETGTWADLGAGSGNFTRALSALLAPGSVVWAVDRYEYTLRGVSAFAATADVAVHTLVGDMTQPLELPLLDGVLMANALHWNTAQVEILRLCRERLRAGGRLIVVEYDTAQARSWIPVPVPRARLRDLAIAAGFNASHVVGTRHSPTNNIGMYAAMMDVGHRR